MAAIVIQLVFTQGDYDYGGGYDHHWQHQNQSI